MNLSIAPSSQFEQFKLRWHGREEGPVSLEQIEQRLANNEIGLLHEIQIENKWMPLRTFLDQRAAQREKQRKYQEEEERRVREESERAAREQEAKQKQEMLAEERRKNDLLQAAMQAQNMSSSDGKANSKKTGLQILGGLLLLAGASLAAYFFAFFDASVSTGSGRIVNLGLMQDRQSGLLLGLGMALVGAVLMVFGRKNPIQ